ncbi:MAG TPA: NADH-quinone oxidoreductase subunit NuoK [Acidobacteriota bacterium]|jgi:NADH-quinone oxidoreductase subunit K|nr:NADH-quinone oxidoreductase subunit NuoK [Acidobacteriota bacterium]HRR25294.1 NADH-quinone oxidoreductase subunit NuoK [Acidobacteriota bacterium]HRR55978.1 NADH-quinone oxidoreductase subunit NuoK [Acidobacteriota bacterium]HRV08369.1 NADH-quinone oxidoreductase subunit NuoK [Acidobacteriota bacterium]
MIPASHYLILAAALFTIGAFGVVVRRNAITMFMCIELMLNAVNLIFLTFARDFAQVDGQVFVFFVMTVAAAEAGVGLAIIVLLSRHTRTVDVDQADRMKW